MSQPTVLIIDDEAWQRGIYERLLTKAGYRCRQATHPAEAIALVEQATPSVIVLDALLEGNTAFVLLNELQSDATLAAIPIVLSTNIAADLSLRDMAPYGVRRIIDKTTAHPADIVTAVKAVLA